MSRILVIGINYPPENIGVGKYTGEFCDWLVANGHDVRVITAPPYYPAWKVWKSYRSWAYQREHIAGVDVVRCPVWVPSQPRGFTRLLHLGSFAISTVPALLYSLAFRPNLVITIAPTLANAPAAWGLAYVMRAH